MEVLKWAKIRLGVVTLDLNFAKGRYYRRRCRRLCGVR